LSHHTYDHYAFKYQSSADIRLHTLDLGSPNSRIVQMVGGTSHLLILTSDNQLYAWGLISIDSVVPRNLSDNGAPDGWRKLQSPNMKSWNTIDAVDCGGFYSLALVNHGRELWGGGSSSMGEFGNSEVNGHDWTLLLNVDNLVDKCQQHNILFRLRSPIDFLANNPSDGSDNQRYHRITHMSAGYYFWIVVLDNRYIFTCGEQRGRQLCRDRQNEESSEYQLISEQGMLNGKIIKEVRAGFRYWMVLTTDNQLYSCGENSYNQLGVSVDNERLLHHVDLSHSIPNYPVSTIRSLLITQNSYFTSAFLSTDAKVYSTSGSEMTHVGDSSFAVTKETFITPGDMIQYTNSYTMSVFVINGIEAYSYHRGGGILSPMDLSHYKLERGNREILGIYCGYYGDMNILVGKPVSHLHRHFSLMSRARKAYMDVEILTAH